MRRRVLIAALGSAAGWPAVAQVRPGTRRRRIGILMSTTESDPDEASAVAAFISAIAPLGWRPDDNVELTVRWGGGDAARMRANAREMAALAPDVILVKGGSLPAAQEATSSIPIVFVALSDAAAEDFVASLARPAGNVTGFASREIALVGKRLELLRDLSAGIDTVLYVRSRTVGAGTQSLFEGVARQASASGVKLVDGPVESDADIERVFSTFGQNPKGGLVVAFNAFTTVKRDIIVRLAAHYRLPAVYPLRAFVHSGGLCSYGFNQDGQFRQAATYVDRILKGERPGALPVQEPTRFELMLNLRTAKALGLALSPMVLARADEVIE